MPKKISLSIVIVIIFIVTSSIPVNAQIAKSNSSDFDDQVTLPNKIEEKIMTKVKLTNQETGDVIFLVPKLVNFQQYPSGLTILNYEVGIPIDLFENKHNKTTIFDYLLPNIVNAASKNYSGCDSTISGCASLTFYFTDFGSHMYANYYQVVWTKKDPTVTFITGKLGGKCYANWWGRTGLCNNNSYTTINGPTSGTTYSYTPSFAGSGNQTIVDDFNGQYAYQNLSMKRGATNWSFYTCVAIGGSALSFGCY